VRLRSWRFELRPSLNQKRKLCLRTPKRLRRKSTALANDGVIRHDGQEFHALEPLFLHLTGERYADLNWL